MRSRAKMCPGSKYTSRGFRARPCAAMRPRQSRALLGPGHLRTVDSGVSISSISTIARVSLRAQQRVLGAGTNLSDPVSRLHGFASVTLLHPGASPSTVHSRHTPRRPCARCSIAGVATKSSVMVVASASHRGLSRRKALPRCPVMRPLAASPTACDLHAHHSDYPLAQHRDWRSDVAPQTSADYLASAAAASPANQLPSSSGCWALTVLRWGITSDVHPNAHCDPPPAATSRRSSALGAPRSAAATWAARSSPRFSGLSGVVCGSFAV